MAGRENCAEKCIMPCQLRAVTAAVAAGTALGQMLAVVGGVAQKCAVGQLPYGSGQLRKNFRFHRNFAGKSLEPDGRMW